MYYYEYLKLKMKTFKIIEKHPRYEISPDGVIRNRTTKRIKSQYVGSTGYYMVTFSVKNKSNPERVHRLLAMAFIPNPKNLPEVNHKDGNKLNYCLDNMEWVTHKENMEHAFAYGLANNTGERNGMSKLTEAQVVRIKELLKSGMSQYKIAALIGGISRSAVMNIKNRGQWKHV